MSETAQRTYGPIGETHSRMDAAYAAAITLTAATTLFGPVTFEAAAVILLGLIAIQQV